MEGGAKTELLDLLYCKERRKRGMAEDLKHFKLLLRGLQREPLIDSKSRDQRKHTPHLFLLASNGERFKILAAGSRNQK